NIKRSSGSESTVGEFAYGLIRANEIHECCIVWPPIRRVWDSWASVSVLTTRSEPISFFFPTSHDSEKDEIEGAEATNITWSMISD
ncbi:hypothetical protein U1Q18_013569, partial [Sarracenia purpurea var. burkii]